MKITIDREPLLTALTRMSGVVKRSGTIAILQHVMLDAGDGTCRLTCTNLDIQASIAVPCSVATPGATTLSAERLREICSRLPDGAQIEIDATDPLRASVKAGRSKFSVGALPAKDFPLLATMDGGAVLEASAGALLRLLTIGSASMGDTAPLDCCLLESRGDVVRVVSTDRGAITLCDMPAKGFEKGGKTMLGPETVNILLRALGAMPEAETATLTVAPGKMLAAFLGGMSLISRVVDGEYPKYERVIPDPGGASFTVDTDTFAAMVRRAQIASHNINIDLAEGRMEILAHDQASGDTSDESAESDWDGPARRIAINSAKLLGVMEYIRTENTIMQGEPGMRPIRITETRDDSDWLGVVMPIVGSH